MLVLNFGLFCAATMGSKTIGGRVSGTIRTLDRLTADGNYDGVPANSGTQGAMPGPNEPLITT